MNKTEILIFMGHILVEETDKPKNKISEMDNMLGGNKCHGKKVKHGRGIGSVRALQVQVVIPAKTEQRNLLNYLT